MSKIAVVLTEGYADWECAWLNAIGRSMFGLNPIVVTPTGMTVISMGNLITLPMEPMEIVSPETFDILVLCGGVGWDENEFADVVGLAGAFLGEGKTVGAICGATLGLARAGLLDDRDHTSNSLAYLKSAPRYRGAERYRDTPGAVSDRRLVTAPGTAPAQFAAEIFRAAGATAAKIDEFLDMAAGEHRARVG
jgi:putative intracellular protease/amidase